MAAVDLYGGDAERIRNQYRTSLGRDASDDEVSGWLSGSYGGGGTDDWLRQISGSHEAQQRQPQAERPPQTPTPPVIGQNPDVSRPMQYTDETQARQGLANVYQNTLGRSASEQELTNWLSGAYGFGSGVQDYDKFVNAIMSSSEARNYRPPTTHETVGGYQDINYWQRQGVPTIDIFDPFTGQLKPGWERDKIGYVWRGQGRPGGQTPTAPTGNVPGPQGGNYQQWFQQLTQGKRISPRTLVEMEPLLNQYGIRLGPRNARGFTDGIVLPDGTFVDVILSATEDGGTGWGWIIPGPGGGGGGQQFGGGLPGVQLPNAQYNDPHTRLLEEMMLGRINQLQSGQDQGYQQLISYLQQRFNELQTPGRTGAENEVIRTQALDPIERDRTAAKKRAAERLAAKNITQESGIFEDVMRQIDAAFDSERATSQNVMASNELNRREGRSQYAEGLAGMLYDIPQRRNREALGYAGALADLGPQRLQMALQAMGAGGSPQSMFQSLMQLAQMNQDSALLNSQQSGRLWQGLGSVAAMLANAGQ